MRDLQLGFWGAFTRLPKPLLLFIVIFPEHRVAAVRRHL
jgi:hypothetical protein